MIFIAMEVAMILGVTMLTFLTDWKEVIDAESGWMFQLLIVLMSILAVIFQKEQQEIEWNDEE